MKAQNLSEVVEVVLAVDPAVRRSLVEAVGLVKDAAHVGAAAITEVERALEQLSTHIVNNSIINLSTSPSVGSLIMRLASSNV